MCLGWYIMCSLKLEILHYSDSSLTKKSMQEACMLLATTSLLGAWCSLCSTIHPRGLAERLQPLGNTAQPCPSVQPTMAVSALFSSVTKKALLELIQNFSHDLQLLEEPSLCLESFWFFLLWWLKGICREVLSWKLMQLKLSEGWLSLCANN